MASNTRPTLAEARAKAEKYCAYQERSHKEVEQKLRELGLNSEETSDILVHLIKTGFLNEERFAIAFAHGKFRAKGWGIKKIVYHLKNKGINDKLIARAISKIESDDYINTLTKLIEKKDAQLKETDRFKKMAAVSKFLQQRGFESETIIREVRKFYEL